MSDNYLIVVPTYNEAENIQLFLDSLNDIESDILVVDDNSPDGTSDLVKELSLIHIPSPRDRG